MTKIYWHGSSSELSVGDVLRSPFFGMKVYATSGGHLSGDEGTEGVLERARPSEFISRSHAVFMTGCLDDVYTVAGDTDYICAVVSPDKVTFHDAAWVSEIQQAMKNGQIEQARLYASYYWLGVHVTTIDNSVMEYIASSAEVMHVWGPDKSPDENFSVKSPKT